MDNFKNATIAKYLKIAVNLASRIASGEINEGERLKGRSILSTEYNVSPETIRRAMSILSDKSVVEINVGSGIVVLSREKALQFVRSFKENENIVEIEQNLANLMKMKNELEDKIEDTTKSLIDMYKHKRTDLITPAEVTIPKDSPIIGKSIGSLEVWHNTGATIIGIIQKDTIIISPGPYYEFDMDDCILIVGDENVVERFNAFVRGI